jgi:hypothetical protein
MRLILEGRLKPAMCSCTWVRDDINDLNRNTGIAVARSCPAHGHMLDGYMWHPALRCDCIVTKLKNGGGTQDKSKCKMHRPPPSLPIEPSVMK